MAMYVSEYTQWMRDWMDKHPEEQQVQKSGRALWWDKPAQDQEELRRQAAACVPQKSYYYDAN